MNNNIPFFSVIVPVYNVGNYVERGLRSLQTQTFRDFEVLVVDDGSTDNSGLLCDKFKKDNRFRIFHKANGGASTARNLGLENAVGKWVVYMDPDDWVDCNFLQCYFDMASDDFELLSQGYKITDTSKNFVTCVFEEEGEYCGESVVNLFENMLYSGQFGYLWCKAFKRDVIEKYYIRYDESLRRMQDVDWIAQYCIHVQKVNNTEACYYNYYWVGQGFHKPGSHKLLAWSKVYLSFNQLIAGKLTERGRSFFLIEFVSSVLKEKDHIVNKGLQNVCSWICQDMFEERFVLRNYHSGIVRLFSLFFVFRNITYLKCLFHFMRFCMKFKRN